MIDELTLHIGHPKTGTTSLQATFYESASVLARHGVFYDTRNRTHHRFARIAQGYADDLTKCKPLRELTDDIAASKLPRAFIGSEAFVRCTRAQAQAFVEHLRRFARRVKVLLYVRHPVTYAASAAHQGARIGRPLAAIVAEPRILDLTDLIATWRKAVGADNLIVRPFARPLLTNGDVIDDVLGVMGALDAAPDMTRVQVNEGLSVLGIHLIDAANRLVDDPPVPQRLIRIFEAIEGPRYVIPEPALAMAAVQAEPHLAMLERDFGIRLPAPTETPSDPVGLSPAELESLAKVMLTAADYIDAWDRAPASRIVGLTSPFARVIDRPPQNVASALGRLGLGGWLGPREASTIERKISEADDREEARERIRDQRRAGRERLV
ncbi:hypothetical protein L1787_24915 [Acuticoccus sp. M5D2P5]|uniref:hypothetical protein n=1 Tax=Acuticoccus kalidii TaxID=2910977 RepID=UPI001F1E0BEC|nr:hypothetical protein [Acuticoccus kalidii]MCF3936638.1 hypothetical protein [Acuticoccus kalidii]